MRLKHILDDHNNYERLVESLKEQQGLTLFFDGETKKLVSYSFDNKTTGDYKVK